MSAVATSGPPRLSGERAIRLALSCVIEGGDPAIAEVATLSGADAAWDQVSTGRFGDGLAERAAHLDLDRVLSRAARCRARFVVPGDDEWPERLGDLRFCDEVQRRGGVPFGLWLRGPGHLAQLAEQSVAIVGSRAATPYGTTVATDLGAELAESGFTVVSGGAYGIDTAAHQGAMAVGGPTSPCWPMGSMSLIRKATRSSSAGSPSTDWSSPSCRREPIPVGCASSPEIGSSPG